MVAMVAMVMMVMIEAVISGRKWNTVSWTGRPHDLDSLLGADLRP